MSNLNRPDHVTAEERLKFTEFIWNQMQEKATKQESIIYLQSAFNSKKGSLHFSANKWVIDGQ